MHICTLYKEMQIHLFDLTITLTPMCTCTQDQYPGTGYIRDFYNEICQKDAELMSACAFTHSKKCTPFNKWNSFASFVHDLATVPV